MNKFALFGLIIAWLLIATYFINVLENYQSGIFSVDNPVQEIDIGGTGFLSQITGMIKTFFNIFLFQIEGLPVIVVVICFQVPAFIVLYMVIDVVKDVIPFT